MATYGTGSYGGGTYGTLELFDAGASDPGDGSAGIGPPVRVPVPYWTFLLTSSNGTPLAELSTATGRNLTYIRNGIPEARMSISHDDESAGLVFDAIRSGTPLLRAYRDGVLRFHGYLAPFDEELEETALVNLVFRGPFGRLLGDGQNRGRFTGASRIFAATDAGQIAKTLIDETTATGIATTGTIDVTKPRDRTYAYANVGEAIINLTQVLDGFDFEIAPIEYSAGNIGELTVYASQGSTQDQAIFQYGPGTIANVRKVSRQLQPPINTARVLGAGGLFALKTDAASIAQHGAWWVQQSAPDVIEQATLDDKAQALLRPDWIRVVRFYPDPTLAPSPWDAFWLGDAVSFYGRRGAFGEDLQARVHKIVVVVDDEGNESYEVEDPSFEGSMIEAQVEVEVDDSGNDFVSQPNLPGVLAELSARVANVEVIASS